MKKCTECGNTDDKPLGLNRNGEPFLACCPDNNYVEMTAVEWLIEEIECRGLVTKELRIAFQQAKEIEKQQIIDAYINGIHLNLLLSDCMSHEDIVGYANKYYNETFNK